MSKYIVTHLLVEPGGPLIKFDLVVTGFYYFSLRG